jgi:hypothetical protein
MDLVLLGECAKNLVKEELKIIFNKSEPKLISGFMRNKGKKNILINLLLNQNNFCK